MKIIDPIEWARLEEEIVRIEREFAAGRVGITQCGDLCRYLRSRQKELEKEE